MRPSRATALGLLALLSACGGGGSSGPLITITILADAGLDGYVRSDGVASWAGAPAAGDLDFTLPGLTGRGFYSFPLAAIPAGATIQSARLELTQEFSAGTPYATHGALTLDHMNYGPTLDAADFNAAALLAAFGNISTDATLGMKTADATLRVIADVAAARANSQFRLRFSVTDSDNDATSDVTRWTDAELSAGGPAGTEPRLIVTYTP